MNWDISEDEMGVLVVTSIVTVVAAWRWYAALARVTRLGCPAGQRPALGWVPVFCLGLLWFVLSNYTAQEVRENQVYMWLFMTTGVTWLAVGVWLFRLVELSVRDDALEQRNLAAVVATCGGLIGITLAYAGSNIGEGPSIWNTIFCAVVSLAGFMALWFTYEMGTNVSEAVTLDRDVASAMRLAGLQIAVGLLLGRAVAGDWVSVEQSMVDFWAFGWPAPVLTALAIGVHRWLRPSPDQPQRPLLTCGVAPAIVFLLVAVLYVFTLGRWN